VFYGILSNFTKLFCKIAKFLQPNLSNICKQSVRKVALSEAAVTMQKTSKI